MTSENDPSGLELVLAEYAAVDSITFERLIGWESQLNDPHESLRLYNLILSDRVLATDDHSVKRLDAGLLGYIKGQTMNALRTAEEQTTTDSLTGLANKHGYEQGLERCFARARREDYARQGKNIALIAIDVNKFKEEANDKYGHHFGDKVLKYIGEALKKYVRGTDLKARVGGDEFMLVIDTLKTEKPQDFLSDLTRRINDYIQRSIAVDHPGKTSQVSVSLGMSIYGQDAQDRDELQHHADMAMYHAKRNAVIVNGKELHFQVYDSTRSYD
ncbi:TPA: GGDEF domain-containing protein [Candidatus Woesearchaeota archaeon]|nr:GGDEF domain-containing protein [Candidatus Woesearchaeota archaeon]